MPEQTTNAAAIGPADRESFFAAQRRNRRATWRLSAVSVLAAVVMGIPLALVLTPLIYALALVIADIINYFLPLPASVWQQADEMAKFALTAWNWLFEHTPADPRTLALGAGVMLLPGALLSLVLWIGVNALFRRAGVGGALLALKAREPNLGDLKELQLADVVQEMSIAAGLPAPRVMLIDAAAANAAAIGTSPADARIVVSRGLIDDLNRDELEGALAHLVASIGNGDLRIAFTVTSVFETCGLIVAIVNSPFGPLSRHTLWRIVRYGLVSKKNAEGSAEEAAAVAALLTRSTGLETDDIDKFFDTSKKSVLRSVRNFLLFPFFFTNTAIKLSLWFFSITMLGPAVTLLWRTRIYLADASAVQFTRNPDGLAEALRKLNSDRGAIPGGEWASHLFLVNPAGSDRAGDEKPTVAQQEMLARAWAASGTGANSESASPSSADLPSVVMEIAAARRAAVAGDDKALARLIAFGQAASSARGIPFTEIPTPADIAAARRGDIAALRHLKEFNRKSATANRAQSDSDESSDNSTPGFVGFHPSVKRRLKRLDRMGAHVTLESDGSKTWPVILVLSIILGPFLLLAAGLLVLLIAIMTMASLTFLTIWLAVIHELFVVFTHH